MMATQIRGIRSFAVWALAVLALGAMFALPSVPAQAQARTPYVLGAVLSLSGPVAANGVPMR